MQGDQGSEQDSLVHGSGTGSQPGSTAGIPP